MSDPRKPYWESCVFLDLGKNFSPPTDLDYVNRLKALWRRSAKGEFPIVTSALSIAEVLRIRNQPRPTDAEAAIIRGFFDSSNILLVELSRIVAEQARDLVWTETIRPKDAIHVASAIAAECDVLYTRDDLLLSKSEALSHAPGLRILSPSSYPLADQLELGES